MYEICVGVKYRDKCWQSLIRVQNSKRIDNNKDNSKGGDFPLNYFFRFSFLLCCAL